MTVTKENVVEAHKEIVEAQEHQKSTGKWMCIILVVIIVVATIIVVPVVVSASKKKN